MGNSGAYVSAQEYIKNKTLTVKILEFTSLTLLKAVQKTLQ